MVKLRPKRLAQKYNISPNTLRNYEANGYIPSAERSANGYRIYTELHETYLACILTMAPAFGMEVTAKVMLLLQQGELDNAMWIVREHEVLLYREKEKLEALSGEFEAYADGRLCLDTTQRLSIQEISVRTGVPRTAIRYWEQAGLLSAERDPENNYRLYDEAHILKIRLIQSLQYAVYSEETVTLKQIIAAADPYQIKQMAELANHIRTYQNKTIRSQMRGLHALYELIRSIDSTF